MARNYKDEHWNAIYVVAADENGPAKIGVSTDISKRVETMQTGCWLPLKVYDMRYVVKKDENNRIVSLSFKRSAYELEAIVHRILDECGLRMVGEWFDITVHEAIEVIQKVAKEQNMGAVGLQDLASVDLTGRADAHMEDARNKMVANIAITRMRLDEDS